MAFDYDSIKNRHFEDVEQTYTVRDSIIYALGLGFGHDPLDESQLPYLFEEADFAAVPTFSVVLASPGFWAREPDTGIVWQKVLHGEQKIVIHKTLPPAATVIGKTSVSEVLDKGADKGALIYVDRDIYDKANGDHLATLTSTTFARGNGGFGGASGPQPQPHVLPEREPDTVCDLPSHASAALLYRLSGTSIPCILIRLSPKVPVSRRPFCMDCAAWVWLGTLYYEPVAIMMRTGSSPFNCGFQAPSIQGKLSVRRCGKMAMLFLSGPGLLSAMLLF